MTTKPEDLTAEQIMSSPSAVEPIIGVSKYVTRNSDGLLLTLLRLSSNAAQPNERERSALPGGIHCIY